MKYFSKTTKKSLKGVVILEWDIGTIRRFFTQEMALRNLARNESSIAFVLELGLKPQHKLDSLAS
jgi:hypothetical protein